MTDEHEPRGEIVTTGERLASIGLTPEALKGAKVFDIHGGQPTFQGTPEANGLASLADVNLNDPRFEADQLPVTKGERFTHITVFGSALQGDLTYDASAFALLEDAIDTLTPGGQIRIHNPFQGFESEEDELPESELAYYYSISGNHPDNVRFSMVRPDEQNKLNKPYLVVSKK